MCRTVTSAKVTFRVYSTYILGFCIVYFSEIFRVYASSLGYRGTDGNPNAVIRWQNGDNLDTKKTRGHAVAIINPLTNEVQYDKFDTQELYGVSVKVVCF